MEGFSRIIRTARHIWGARTKDTHGSITNQSNQKKKQVCFWIFVVQFCPVANGKKLIVCENVQWKCTVLPTWKLRLYLPDSHWDCTRCLSLQTTRIRGLKKRGNKNHSKNKQLSTPIISLISKTALDVNHLLCHPKRWSFLSLLIPKMRLNNNKSNGHDLIKVKC